MSLTESSLVQMRVAHLSMIQGIVGRMSLISGTLKGFCVTVVTAVLALQPSSWIGRLGIVGVVVVTIAFTDAAYLGMERQFRELYNMVQRRDLSESADLSIRRPGGFTSSYAAALTSWAVLWFYLPVGALALILGYFGQ